MDDMDLDYFKTIIEERIDELTAEMEQATDSTAPIAPDVAIGRLSRLDAMQMQQMALASQRSRKLEINRLRTSLVQIEKKTYGICQSCGGLIKFERLRAQPDTRMCSACAEKFAS